MKSWLQVKLHDEKVRARRALKKKIVRAMFLKPIDKYPELKNKRDAALKKKRWSFIEWIKKLFFKIFRKTKGA
uniref:Uncharacterized protein n=1 Tax=viral metagenome TaxID=1070528 RepID=A0A6H1ZDQ9_9ZZZZ